MHVLTVDIGALLQRQLAEAEEESAVQSEIFRLFSERLLDGNAETWIAEAVAFEKNPSLPDPYYREPAGAPCAILFLHWY